LAKLFLPFACRLTAARASIDDEFHGRIIILFAPLFICFHVRQIDQMVEFRAIPAPGISDLL
jgi:hypothetical protein